MPWAPGNSRYFEYTDQTALQQIKDYRDHQFPLDNLVIDTDWRVGGGEGYDVNTHDFPDIKHFFAEAHENHVWVMFNDHLKSVAPALDPMSVRMDTMQMPLQDDSSTSDSDAISVAVPSASVIQGHTVIVSYKAAGN